MATRTFEQDSNALSHSVGDSFAAVCAYVGQGLKTMGPLGRRVALTAFGAVLSLGLGAATASAFRLPSEVTDPTQPQDQVLAQSELPSEAAARAYALENPPVYTVAADHADAAPPVDTPVESTALQDDAAPTPAVSYTGPTDEPLPASNAPTETPTPTATSDTDASAD